MTQLPVWRRGSAHGDVRARHPRLTLNRLAHATVFALAAFGAGAAHAARPERPAAPADGAAVVSGAAHGDVPVARALVADCNDSRGGRHHRVVLASPRLQALHATLCAGGDTDAFWREVDGIGTPLVETVPADTLTGDEAVSPLNSKTGNTTLVTFLWRGARHNVRILGAPSGEHDDLHRLGRSDVWYRSYLVPAQSRLSYQMAPDVPDVDGTAMERRRAILKTLQPDPRNHHPFLVQTYGGKTESRSSLTLPDAPPQPWLEPRDGVAKGTLEPHRFESKILGNTRDVYVYRPAGWREGDAAQGVLVVFDAHAYVNTVPTPVILDNLIAEGRLPRTAALIVGVIDPATRARELPPNRDFARFMADELMPWAKAQGIAAPAAHTVVAGSSYGGLASAWVALQAPQWFGNVLSQSGSYWWAPATGSPEERDSGWLQRQYVKSPRLPIRFYVSAGQFEDGRGPGGIGTAARHMRDVLLAKGYRVTYSSTPTNHDYLHWRGSLACGLIALIGTPTAQRALTLPADAPGSLALTCPTQ